MTRKQYAIYVDANRCVNCRACEIACKLENDLPAGPRYIMVTETEISGKDRDTLMFLPIPCMHCGEPACEKACPTGAITKRVEDGIVTVDRKKCIGCRSCLIACPFGVPQFGADGKMQKCQLCLHRLSDGKRTACQQACMAEAILVGTVEEISAYVRQRYASNSRRKMPMVMQWMD
ncbi:MAG TPA: 4Fe-4S dicluster domain-containing protein [Clostridia bacterium]|nr:4Fe-4S dicluster domain-containing protein [Clostridia bacterium]